MEKKNLDYKYWLDPNRKARTFIFTDWEAHGKDWWEDFFTKEKMTGLTCQQEMGKTAKMTDERLHTQGAFRYQCERKLGTVQRKLIGMHIEIAKNPVEAFAYGRKPETRINGPWMFGKEPRPGERTPRVDAAMMIAEGKTKEAYLEYPDFMMREGNGIHRWADVVGKPNYNRQCEAWILWGPKGGCGKSYIIKTICEYAEGFIMTSRNEWWDGYIGNTFIGIQDFDPRYFSAQSFKLLCDEGPYRMNTKGGHVNCQAELVGISTNIDPEEWWPELKDRDPIERRAHLSEVVPWHPIDRRHLLGKRKRDTWELKRYKKFCNNMYICNL